MKSYSAIDPNGVQHQTKSYEDVKYLVFGKLKSHKEFTSVAGSATLDGANEAVAVLKSKWLAGAEFVIAEVA